MNITTTLSFLVSICRYTVDVVDKNFKLDASVTLCIDSACETIEVLEQTLVPIPLCNENFTLPGGNSLNGFFEELGQKAGGAGINLVLESLGLAVGFFFLHVNV